MDTPQWVDRIKKKWNIASNWDFILIMTVFSFAGMSIVFVRKPLFVLFGITATTPFLDQIHYVASDCLSNVSDQSSNIRVSSRSV